ncbi:MAG: hypothetical protein APF84_14925 [Gracilibacter sp. BRH_c7a]|nr:MAG: hypothetical protein APF84_14925 [Gracilibacter sp. BRH_c7a]
MAFKYRLETSLRLADQELDIAQSLLAVEMRTLSKLQEEKHIQAENFAQAIEGQKQACLGEPLHVRLWQRYGEEQKNKLAQIEQEVLFQETVVKESRAKLIQCRINLEKFKKLKQKKLKLYNIEELKKEQAVIDEIPQSQKSSG